MKRPISSSRTSYPSPRPKGQGSLIPSLGPYPLCPFGTSPLDKGSRPLPMEPAVLGFHWVPTAGPYPLCPFGTSSRPLLTFGHFPPPGGIGPLTGGVGLIGPPCWRTKPYMGISPSGASFFLNDEKETKWPRPPSLAPSGQFTLESPGAAHGHLTMPYPAVPYPLCLASLDISP